jgi:hypothetical protein
MKQRSYRLIFVSAIFKNNGGDRQQVSHVWGLCTFADLVIMEAKGKDQSLREAVAKDHDFLPLFYSFEPRAVPTTCPPLQLFTEKDKHSPTN